MNFNFSQEQEELRAQVRRFLHQASPETEVRRLMASAEGYDPARWRQMAQELGLQGLAIPERFGGQGFGPVELFVVFQEFGSALMCTPFFASVALVATAIAFVGTEDDQRTYLSEIASGDVIATLAFNDDDGVFDPSTTTRRATRDGEGYRVDGVATYVVDGHVADLIVVSAEVEGGLSLFAVRGTDPGVERQRLASMDQTRPQSRLVFRGATARLIGSLGDAATPFRRALDVATTYLCAEQIGGANRVLEDAVAYANERVQFGRTIGSFQSIKHKCADMLLDLESATSAAYYAAWCAQEDNDELATAASLAKSLCSDAYFHCAGENIQIHGGVGFTWEHRAHLYFKRATSSRVLLGGPQYHRDRLAERIGV